MNLVTKKAPNFIAPAVLGNGKIIEKFNFKSFIKNKYSVLFFWPMDFTYVCPSEIISFNKRFEIFKSKKVKIIGVSIDSHFVHKAWRDTPTEKGGIGIIKYPMVSDIKHKIINSYGINHPKMEVALRATFIIDKKRIVRFQIINDLPFGRNINEIIRMIDSLKFYEKNGQVCPAQWEKGKDGITTTKEGISKYLLNNINKL